MERSEIRGRPFGKPQRRPRITRPTAVASSRLRSGRRSRGDETGNIPRGWSFRTSPPADSFHGASPVNRRNWLNREAFMKTTVFAALVFASTLTAGTAGAQPAPFNEAGVTMGHWHIVSKDVEANKKLFLGMGGKLFM